MDMREVENIILGMAQLVHENRMLRKENDELRLSVAKHNAFVDSLAGSSKAGKRYEVLSEIESRNSRVNLCNSAGWDTNEDYIYDWEAEAERRLQEVQHEKVE